MTKTLTEQWREGTLPKGYYYIIANTEQKHRVVFYLPERDMEDEARIDLKDQFVLEVLAPVPSYDHFSQLVKKVEQLQEQLKEANTLIKWCGGLCWTGDQREDIFDKYLAKWGVK